VILFTFSQNVFCGEEWLVPSSSPGNLPTQQPSCTSYRCRISPSYFSILLYLLSTSGCCFLLQPE